MIRCCGGSVAQSVPSGALISVGEVCVVSIAIFFPSLANLADSGSFSACFGDDIKGNCQQENKTFDDLLDICPQANDRHTIVEHTHE